MPILIITRYFCIAHMFVLLLSGMSVLQAAEASMTLWPQGAPGALGMAQKDIPTLTAYIPDQPTGSAMLLIPGGSYSGIFEGQAKPFAIWLNKQGITTFVLRYRLGSAGYRYPSQLQDAVEAMRHIRGNYEKWQIDTKRIGVMGFSAGGHLVSSLLTNPKDGDIESEDERSKISSRPDLAILCYPVISMITKPHKTSRKNLIGESPSDDLVRKTSSELQVKPGLPACFVWHTNEDKMVPPDHSLNFVTALREFSVPCEFHLYQSGNHGTGLIGTKHPWLNDLLFWLRGQKFIN
ncbi:MAG: alpha/beta hydrolase [Verrucomicrobiota bacterium]